MLDRNFSMGAVQIIIQWYDRGKKEEIYKEREREAMKREKMLIRGEVTETSVRRKVK